MSETFTKIQNDILDALCRYRLPGEQMQCLLFILRKTVGFNKKADAIPLSQFVKNTGINRGNVARALRQLESKNLIHIKKGSVEKDTITISEYRFNGRFDQWVGSVKKDTGSVIPAKKVVSKKTHSKENYQKKDSPPKGEILDLNEFLKNSIPDHLENYTEKIVEFFDYRQKKPKPKRYSTIKGIQGLFRDLNNCKSAGYDLDICLDIAMERGWQTPAIEYFKPEMFQVAIPTPQYLTPEEQIREFLS